MRVRAFAFFPFQAKLFQNLVTCISNARTSVLEGAQASELEQIRSSKWIPVHWESFHVILINYVTTTLLHLVGGPFWLLVASHVRGQGLECDLTTNSHEK